MKKNSLAMGSSLALCLAITGCSASNASAGQAKALQGVVELDTATLAFEVGGRVDKLSVHEGDRLAGKVVLAQLDESLARPEREARAAELEAARARLALIEAGARSEEIRAVQAEISSVQQQETVLARQRARQAELTSQGAAPSARLDDFDAQQSALVGRREVLQEKLRGLRSGARPQEIEAARAQVQALEAGLTAMDVRISRFKLEHTGTADVLDVHVEQGEVVAPGAPVVTLADLDHPYVDVFVPQGEIASVKVGQPMTVRIDSLREPVRGSVERIGYKTEFTPRYLFSEKERANFVVRVRVRVDDPGHQLRAGVPAFVTSSGEEK
jgi:HlyD family secretion protein